MPAAEFDEDSIQNILVLFLPSVFFFLFLFFLNQEIIIVISEMRLLNPRE